MKKLFLTLMALVTSMAALATDYTGTLTVTVNGEATVQDNVTISVVGNGNDYTLSINNFIMEGIPVGNIVVTAPGTTDNGLTSIVSSQNINISAGEDPDIDETDWLGPELGEVPINMVLAINEFAMTTNIDIYMVELGQTINVKFAQDGELTGYQIKNSGFEKWTASSGEPDHWHGFKSATGSLAGRAKGTLGKSEDKHSGEYSALITSGSVLGIINNGTMTTGRLNAGSMSASNTANHSEMDASSEATDKNGDPFFAVMHGRPDAIKFWLKFSQGTANSSFPYATMSAIITDGSYYQDPEEEDKDYTNKLATAKNNTIATCGWSEFTVPFTYIDKSITGEGVLVTFSTNATAGKGSNGDQVWIDDIAMVYNAAITGIKIKGTPLAGFAQDVYEYNFDLPAGTTFTADDIDATYVSEHAYLVKKVVETDEAVKLFVAVVSNDLNTIKVYTINYAKPQTVVLDGVSFAAGRNWATWYGDQPLQKPENVSVYTVTYNGGNTVTIPARSLSYIPAGVGVLLYSTTPATEVTALPFDGTTVSYTSALQGFLVNTPISNGYVLYNGTFILSESGTLAAHRCYLPIAKSADAPRMLMIASEGTVTGIESLEAVGHGTARYFDINGREVSANAKGVVIVRYSDGTVTKMINR